MLFFFQYKHPLCAPIALPVMLRIILLTAAPLAPCGD